MYGPQFIHIQTFARKPNPVGQCVEQVLGEAERRPEVSRHVERPRLPEVIEGLSIPELRVSHAAMIAAASTTAKVNGKLRRRAVRQDRHTLACLIASYPLSWNQIGHDPYVLAHLEAWEQATIRWSRDQFGACFASAIRHRDEMFPHLHIYALPAGLDGIDATLLHLGKRAKREAMRQLLADGVPKREALRAANLVHREAMREWQDDYHRMVGEPLGLSRTGPKRRRLTNSEYKAETREARLRAERLALIEAREAMADDRAAELDARDQDQDARDRAQDAWQREMEAREDALPLAVTLAAEGRLRIVDGRVQAPLRHHDALHLVWPVLGPALSELVALRDGWSRGVAQVIDLLRRNKVAPDLQGEAMQLLRKETRS